jgi:hypothetical protein
MSRWNDKAERLALHLAAQPALAALIPVTVHRTADLQQTIDEQIAKARGGACVIVKWIGGENPDRQSARLRMGARFSVSLWTRDGRQAGAPAADDLVEAVAESCHGWVDGAPGSLTHRLEVLSVDMESPPGYTAYEILAEMIRV